MCNFRASIYITKFEASKTLDKNLKIEFILIPFFIFLYFLTSNKFSLIENSILILIKVLLLF